METATNLLDPTSQRAPPRLCSTSAFAQKRLPPRQPPDGDLEQEMGDSASLGRQDAA